MAEEFTQEAIADIAENNQVIDAAKEIVKQKQKRPLKSEKFKLHTDPGDNAKYIGHTMELMQMGKTDMSSVEKVRERIFEYFNLCQKNDMKPSIEGFALSFGTDRKSMWQWSNGIYRKDMPQEARDLLKMAYTAINSMMADYMQNGKINPIPAIFLMKNNMGYSDQTEIVVTPNNPLGAETNGEELQKRITDGVVVELPEDDN